MEKIIFITHQINVASIAAELMIMLIPFALLAANFYLLARIRQKKYELLKHHHEKAWENYHEMEEIYTNIISEKKEQLEKKKFPKKIHARKLR